MPINPNLTGRPQDTIISGNELIDVLDVDGAKAATVAQLVGGGIGALARPDIPNQLTPPTAADFNKLLATLRTIGILSSTTALTPVTLNLALYGVTDWSPGIGVIRNGPGRYAPTMEAADLLAAFLAATTVQDYYVDPSKADNSGDGLTLATAKQTVGAVWALAPTAATIRINVVAPTNRILWGPKGSTAAAGVPVRNIILQATDGGPLVIAAVSTLATTTIQNNGPTWTANGDGTYTCSTRGDATADASTVNPPVDWSPGATALTANGLGRAFTITTGTLATTDAATRANLQPGQAYKNTATGTADLIIRPFENRLQSTWDGMIAPPVNAVNNVLLRADDAGQGANPFYYLKQIYATGGSPIILQNRRTTVGGRGTVVLDRCGAVGSSAQNNALSVQAAWLVYTYDWKSDATMGDGLNPHDGPGSSQAGWVTGAPWLVHVRPQILFTGLDANGTNNNETGHESVRALTIMPDYRASDGRTYGFINFAHAICFGGYIGPSVRSLAAGFSETVSADNNADVRLVEVTIGQGQGTYDVNAQGSSSISCYGMSGLRATGNVTYLPLQ